MIDLLVFTLIRDHKTRCLSQTVLHGEGHQVIELRNYQHASSLLENGMKPHLILIEPYRANAQELDSCRKLALQAPDSILCLIIGLGEQHLLHDLHPAGITRFWAKPVVRHDFESLLDEIIHSHSNPELPHSVSSDPPFQNFDLSNPQALALAGVDLDHEDHENHELPFHPYAAVVNPVTHSPAPAPNPATPPPAALPPNHAKIRNFASTPQNQKSDKNSPYKNSPVRPPNMILEEFGDNCFFLAASPSMLEIYHQIKLLAPVDVNVLILGESGTGKEVIARLIHKHSARARQKFLNVNCAALPVDLLESELFGHQQGAFTGAIKDKPGKFELANSGTLLLDEIGEISMQMQAKLLHVLQDGRFTRLGGQQPTKVDVRVLAATNIDMEAALINRTFRQDLYYRLNAFTICVPPLRQRREEIPCLIEETLRRTPPEMMSPGITNFSSHLLDLAIQYDWPGNLRELRNFVTRTIIMQDEDSGIQELESKLAAAPSTHPEKLPLMNTSEINPSEPAGMRTIVRDIRNRTETKMIQDALNNAGWNRRHAAEHLNISYRALLYKIQQHGLTQELQRY